jgi:hypothetical protein
MSQHPRLFIGAGSAVVAALCFAFALEVAPELARPGSAARLDPASASGAPTIPNDVNRALKGDRLRVIVRPDGAEPFDAQAPADPKPPMPDGCESAFGRTRPSPSARPARCVT